MHGVTKLLAAGALAAGLLLPAPAMAAFEAITRVDLNLRIGPATTYGVIDVIPAGYPVMVLGCLEEYYWCDVDFDGLRGWVAGRYLVQPGTAVYLPQWAPAIGLPIVSFSFNIYHDRHYRGRPWHRQRAGHWRGHRQVQRTRQRPQATRERQRPQATRERQRPQATRERQRPQATRDRQRPQATRDRQRPQATRERQRPQATRERQRPQATRERQRPQATRERQRPQATRERRQRQQATGQRRERPQAAQQRRGSEDEERRPRRRSRN